MQSKKENKPNMNHIPRLNVTLLPALGRVLGKTHAEIMESTGIKNTTWYHIMGHPDEITVQQLISIANGLHIPVRRFFSIDDTDVISSREDYIANPYQPCRYDSKALQHLFNLHNITWQGAANVLGISRIHLRKSLLSITRLPVARFLAVCETFGIEPFLIIIDPNPQHINRKKQKKVFATAQENATILQDLTNTQRELVNLKAILDKTMQDMAELGEKLDALIGTYEERSSPKVAKRTAALVKKIVKENQRRTDKQIANSR